MLATPSAAIGKVARRTLPIGTLLTANDVSVPQWIRRGDLVELIARFGDVEVKMNAKALTNAGMNERVLVENISSHRTVQAFVESPGRVIVSH